MAKRMKASTSPTARTRNVPNTSDSKSAFLSDEWHLPSPKADSAMSTGGIAQYLVKLNPLGSSNEPLRPVTRVVGLKTAGTESDAQRASLNIQPQLHVLNASSCNVQGPPGLSLHDTLGNTCPLDEGFSMHFLSNKSAPAGLQQFNVTQSSFSSSEVPLARLSSHDGIPYTFSSHEATQTCFPLDEKAASLLSSTGCSPVPFSSNGAAPFSFSSSQTIQFGISSMKSSPASLDEMSATSDMLLCSNTSPLPSFPALPARRTDEQRKIRVVCLVRKSAMGYHETRRYWHEQLSDHARGLFTVWLNDYHYASPSHGAEECCCLIEYVQVTLAAVSSNENLASSTNGQIIELRTALWADHEVVLCSLGHDGAFSNMKGYLELIRRLDEDSVALSHLIWLDQGNHALIPAAHILSALSRSSDEHDAMALQPFFSDLIKVACNKTLLSLAARKNRQIMGRQRNAKVPVPDHGVLSRTRTRDVQAVEYTPEAKRARQLAGHQSMRLSSHSIISKDGKWICPCCQGKFTARESVIGHLVDEGLKKRICTLCSKPLDEGTKKNNFKQHINRHVDEGQICGINDCEAEMTSTTAMNRHRAAAHPEEVKSKLSSPCPRAMCRIVCSSDDALRKHLKAHQNPSVCCNWCGWQVTFKDLKRHKAKDCVKRPVAVAICPYEGCDEEIEMNHITRHIRNVHTKLADVMEMAEESDQHLLRAWADLIKRM